jgi:preprotein translocase SecF subunit
VTPETITAVQDALRTVYPAMTFPSVESVGPKVSGELIQTAIIAVLASLGAILIYIWLRFEWQFSVGAVAALVHDVILTIGIFSLLQIRFDLATIAALLTIIGYSINDTVVIFDRLRENLIKFKQRPLRDVMNLSVNETLSRTIMTSGTTLLALLALLVLGGDVIRGFVFAIFWGVIVGTYSSVYVAKNVVLMIGVKRDWSKPSSGGAVARNSPISMPDALAAVLADPGLPFVCLVSLIAGLVYGFAGFGSALIFMPLATLFIAPATAVAAFAMSALASLVTVVPGAWKVADRPAVLTMIGAPSCLRPLVS